MEQAYEQEKYPVRDRTLWFSVGTGVVVWVIHFLAIYVVVELVCRQNWLNFTILGISGTQVTTLLITVIGVAIVATAGMVSYQQWRRLREENKDWHSIRERYRFMIFSGLVMNVVFIVLMILTFLPSLVLPVCR
jgi:magnesium-transporting ATPase (P-type)